MVYTVTISPALDYALKLESLDEGMILRAISENLYAGGKGINVSNVLTQLEIPNVALGFVAGFTGAEIERRAHLLGVKTDFIRLPQGNSRINVKIRTADGTETAINARGCGIDDESLNEFYGKIDALGTGDFLVLSGSVPESLPDDVYEAILRRLCGKQAHCIVDAAGPLLRNALKCKPFLIKPNLEELCGLFGQAAETENAVFNLAKSLQCEGARNVLVSMGAEGSLLLTEAGERIRAPLARAATASTVGAGDSMVAGFLAGWLKYGDYQKALALGTAAGAATAFSEGIAKRGEIERVFESLEY